MTSISYGNLNLPVSLATLANHGSFNFLVRDISGTLYPDLANRYNFAQGISPNAFVESYTLAASPQYTGRVNTHTAYSRSSACSGISHTSDCGPGYSCHASPSGGSHAIGKHFLMFSGLQWNRVYSSSYTLEIMFRLYGTATIRVGIVDAMQADPDDHLPNYLASVLYESASVEGVNTVSGDEFRYLDVNGYQQFTNLPFNKPGDRRPQSVASEYICLKLVISSPDTDTFQLTPTVRALPQNFTPVNTNGLIWSHASYPGYQDILNSTPIFLYPEALRLAIAFSSSSYSAGNNAPAAICGFRWTV